MIHAVLFALASLSSAPVGQETDLGRVFKKGEKLAYSVKAALTLEQRGHGLDTWLPSDLDISYQFAYWITDVKSDGIATIRYQRPTMTEVEGETASSAPKTHVEKVNMDMQMSLSPANEVLDIKDLTPKKPKKQVEKDSLFWRQPMTSAPQITAFLGQFLDEIVRLSLFVGSFESSLDFAPRLPFEPAKIGETWKRTVGYSPQKLKGKEGKMEMQRLDYTFKYRGPIDSAGKKVLRVDASLNLNSNLADFIHQLTHLDSSQTHLAKVPLTMVSEIEFDLDPVTHMTLAARAKTTANYQVMIVDHVDALEEVRLKGENTLTLVGKAMASAPPLPSSTPIKKIGGH